MSGSASGRRGGTPSTTTPIAGPWLSPQVVKRNKVPNELPAIVFRKPVGSAARAVVSIGRSPHAGSGTQRLPTHRREVARYSNDSPLKHAFHLSLLDLDDPNIRIPLPLAGYVSICVGLGDWVGTGRPHPQKLAILPACLRQYRAALGAASVELEQDRAGICVASGHHGDRDRGKVAPPDQRLDPNSALQSRFQRLRPVFSRARVQGVGEHGSPTRAARYFRLRSSPP